METRAIRTAVLLSGSGRTLKNLLRRIEQGELAIEICIVISDHPGVRGLQIAEAAGIPTRVLRPQDYELSIEDFSKGVNCELEAHDIELVLMAGFLTLYKIPRLFENRVMNIHPSLIPSFCGKGYYGDRVHRAVLERGAKVSGCTVHFANNQFDEGPIIVQETVAVAEDETPASLAAKVFELECEAYPKAISLFTEGRLVVEEAARVRVLGFPDSEGEP